MRTPTITHSQLIQDIFALQGVSDPNRRSDISVEKLQQIIGAISPNASYPILITSSQFSGIYFTLWLEEGNFLVVKRNGKTAFSSVSLPAVSNYWSAYCVPNFASSNTPGG